MLGLLKPALMPVQGSAWSCDRLQQDQGRATPPGGGRDPRGPRFLPVSHPFRHARTAAAQLKELSPSVACRFGGRSGLEANPLHNREAQGATEPQWRTCSQRKWIMAAQRLSHSPSGIP